MDYTVPTRNEEGYDVFISYRRGPADPYALLLQQFLQGRGLSVFLDHLDLRAGRFDEKLFRIIDQSCTFLVILTAQALDRCTEAEDWLRREIVHAIESHGRIIPVTVAPFQFTPEVKKLDPAIQELSSYNGVEFSSLHIESTISRIIAMVQDYKERHKTDERGDRHEGKPRTSDVPLRTNTKSIFLSYRRVWQAEVSKLADSLRLRGLRVWLDYSDPASFLGASMYDSMRRVILDECWAMLLHATSDIADSPAIWNVEIPAARRRSDDGKFFILPFFRDITPKELTALGPEGAYLAASSGINAVPPPWENVESFLAQKRAETARILLDHLLNRIHGSISLAMWTRPTAALDRNADLLLDWCSVYSGTAGSPEGCEDAHEAIKQLAASLAETSIGELHIEAKIHLSAAVLFGSVFSSRTGFRLFIKQENAAWDSYAAADNSRPQVVATQIQPRKGDIVLIVSVSRPETVSSVERALPQLGISVGGRIVVRPELGESRESIPSQECARRFAGSVASALMTARSEWGPRRTHLFISSPVALAVLIGRELNGLGPIDVYEHDKDTDSYEKTFTV